MAGLNFDFGTLLDGLEEFGGPRFDAAVMARLEVSAARLESYAKQNRKWKDQTGHARQRLNCRVSRQGGTKYRLTLAHGVSYGINLEFGHEKKYAIIFPTLETQGPEVIDQFQAFLETL